MKDILSNWKKYLEEEPLAEAKVYSLGDSYHIAFHPGNVIYVTWKTSSRKRKWVLETDEESFNHLKSVLLKGDPFQIEVTRDELMRGRYGKLTVIAHNPYKNDDEEIDTIDDISFDF